MKNFAMILAALVVVFAVSDANAQCVVRRGVGFNNFGGSAVVVNNGFSGFSGFTQSAVVVPQSTAFFTGGRSVAFINQPAFVNVGAFAFPSQQVNVRRGVFGNTRRVQVNNFGAAGLQVINPSSNVVVGRRKVFVNGF